MYLMWWHLANLAYMWYWYHIYDLLMHMVSNKQKYHFHMHLTGSED